MADLADMIQKLAYYQAGGRGEGGDTLDKINAGTSIVDKAINDVLAVKKAKMDRQKTAAETQKLEIENAPVTEVLGTPRVKAQIAEAEAAPIPAEDLISGRLNSRQAGIDKATATARNFQNTFGNMTFGQYKDFNQANKYMMPESSDGPLDLKPLSTMMTFEDAKRVVPTITPEQYKTMTIGGMKQFVGAGRQEDLNHYRGINFDLRRDNTFMEAADSLNNTLRPIREQKSAILSSNELADAIRAGNTVAAAAIGAKQAKVLGDTGALSNVDVTRYVRSGWIPQRIGDILGQWLLGTPTGATVQEIQEVNQALANALNIKEQEIIEEKAKAIAYNYGVDETEAVKRLGKEMQLRSLINSTGGSTLKGFKPQPAPAPATQQPAPSGGSGMNGFDAKSGRWGDPEKQKRYEAYKAAQGK